MPVTALHDRATIESFVRLNLGLHIYSLGDLDDFFWPYTTWYGLEHGGELRAIVLLYSGSDPPTMMAIGDPPADDLRQLLTETRKLLPVRMYAHLSVGCRGALEPLAHVNSKGLFWKMVLASPRLDVSRTECVVRLTFSDEAELRELYAQGYPDNWFNARMLEIGFCYGRRVEGVLVSAATVHVYSQRYRVAALGNIVTHPDHRGKGHATVVTAALCRDLLAHVDCIGLNVKATNTAAIACYERLGFEKVADYEEMAITLAIT